MDRLWYLYVQHVCIVLIYVVMAMIPDESARVKRLRVYERELGRKMAFDEKFRATRDRRTALLRRSRTVAGSDNPIAVDILNNEF